MVLPVPKLDDRTFQDLVNETKRQIPRYCPEWTDHNVSDPGVTLIELFAYMVDMLLYRINRVPERNYVKWLEMLGLKLEPPRPARTDVTFYLSGPQPDTVTLPAGTEVATVRTESQQSIGFSTDVDMTIYVPTLFQLLVSRDGQSYHDYLPALRNPSLNVGIFQDPPQPNDALYYGYHEDLRGHILRLTIDSQIEGIGVDPKDPPLVWECWNAEAQEWVPLYMESDTTGGLNRGGEVILHVPYSARPRDIDGRVAFWLRCRATAPRPRQPAYSAAPRLREVETVSLGGIVPASQVERIENEVLGRSNGKPGQEWLLNYPPVLERRPDEVLQVEQEDGSFLAWEEVPDFGASRPGDMHYTLDSLTGIIRFGPAIRDAGGRELQYGSVPPLGSLLRFTRYRTGGGTKGNVGTSAINVLKSSIPYIASVTNGAPAIGGEDAETLEMAMLRGPQILRARSRAVTTDDFEYLAMQATPEVSRARCIPPTPEEVAAAKSVIKLLVVPSSGHTDTPIPPVELRLGDRTRQEVMDYLNARRLITALLQLDPPDYRYVCVEVDVKSRKRINKDALQATIERSLYSFINPVNGGPDGTGWPWERNLFQSEITALVQSVDGVEYVEAVRFFVADTATGTRSRVEGTVTCPRNGLLASFSHMVNVK
ncbi:MAG: putative baseplate assembly protein [Chloroflexi bacterium]|nr:putative baseplate assembly protein [Chloroflexota bacterium]